jgi:hypothetical protein
VKTETHDADRAEMIAGLRAMADWLEAHPGVAVDRFVPVSMTLFAASEDEARAIRAAAPGGWEKDAKGDYLSYARRFSGEGYRCVVEYEVHVNKQTTCERVQVGVKHVEAVEAHSEPVYEWRCAPAQGGVSGSGTEATAAEPPRRGVGAGQAAGSAPQPAASYLALAAGTLAGAVRVPDAPKPLMNETPCEHGNFACPLCDVPVDVAVEADRAAYAAGTEADAAVRHG